MALSVSVVAYDCAAPAPPAHPHQEGGGGGHVAFSAVGVGVLGVGVTSESVPNYQTCMDTSLGQAKEQVRF